MSWRCCVLLRSRCLSWRSNRSARRLRPRHGVLAGEFGAVLAVTATLCDYQIIECQWIIGADDVNPAARTGQSSPIFGMPILDVDKARTVMVIKRSMNPGFAGIDNPLYYFDKTLMLFGDAKGFVGDIVRELTGGGD